MKIARISLPDGPRFAVLDEHSNHHVLAGDPLYSGYEQTGKIVPAGEARIVAPMIPRSKVIVNLGSVDDGRLVLKPNTSVVGPDVPMTVPTWASRVGVVTSFAVIIARMAKDVAIERVSDVVFGYTLAISGFEIDELEAGRLVEASAFDTSTILGPVIETDAAVAGSDDITLAVNDDVVSMVDAAGLAHVATEMVSKVSRISTLLPGDVVLLESPGVPIEVAVGDDLIARHSELGELRAPVA